MQLETLYSLVNDDLAAVDSAISSQFEVDVPFINDVCGYIINGGGKRLRPLTVLLSAKAVNYTGNSHIDLAAAMEFFHTATLLHDDVIDESRVRRGRATANEVFGAKASVLIGDFLFTRAFQLLSRADDIRVIRLLANTSNTITKGEVQQLLNCNDPSTSEAQYMQVINDKTAVLFSCAAQLGALLANSDETVLKNMEQFGLHLGNAFQLVDDALDYCSSADKIGKAIGDDLAEGKPTLPLIHAMAQGNDQQKQTIRKAICDGSIAHLDEILQAIEDTKAIDYTYQTAQREVDAAITHLNCLEDSEYKDALSQLSLFALQREF